MMCSCLLVHVRNLLTLTLLNYICVFFIKSFNPVIILGEKMFGMKTRFQKEAGFMGCASSVP